MTGARIELAARWLKASCSTTELPGQMGWDQKLSARPELRVELRDDVIGDQGQVYTGEQVDRAALAQEDDHLRVTAAFGRRFPRALGEEAVMMSRSDRYPRREWPHGSRIA